MNPVPEITDFAAATDEQLKARDAYSMSMYLRIRHRQTRDEWLTDACNCRRELERRAPAHPGDADVK